MLLKGLRLSSLLSTMAGEGPPEPRMQSFLSMTSIAERFGFVEYTFLQFNFSIYCWVFSCLLRCLYSCLYDTSSKSFELLLALYMVLSRLIVWRRRPKWLESQIFVRVYICWVYISELFQFECTRLCYHDLEWNASPDWTVQFMLRSTIGVVVSVTYDSFCDRSLKVMFVCVVYASFVLLKGEECKCEPNQCWEDEQVCFTLSQEEDWFWVWRSKGVRNS